MQNVPIQQLVIGKEYVFGKEIAGHGFAPCNIDYSQEHSCRAVIAKKGRKYVDVYLNRYGIDKKYCGEGFYEIDVAKTLYRKALKDRQAKGYPQTDEEIDKLVGKL